MSKERRLTLNRAKEYFEFVQTSEEELGWLVEKQEFCQQLLNAKDINAVMQANRLYKVLESEMKVHWQQSKNIMSSGEMLLTNSNEREDIQARINSLQQKWDKLRCTANLLLEWLQKAVSKFCQSY